ncbi:MAG: DUF3160 domain-containing protein [Clostridiales bacterium]|nr:DUF3160 domain-containing protein [Clostridiales bacterium]
MKKLAVQIVAFFIIIAIAVACGGSKQEPEPEPEETPMRTPRETPRATRELPDIDEYSDSEISRKAEEIERASAPKPFAPLGIKAEVKPTVLVKKDLSNIANLNSYKNLTDAQKELIASNGFAVSPTDYQQLFHVYEENNYLLIPSFVTTDAILQLYHIYYDYSLRNVELVVFLPPLEKLAKEMTDKLSILKTESEAATEAKDKALAYFSVALSLLSQNPVNSNSKDELSLINEALGPAQSPSLGQEIDYSAFAIKGHYTKNDDYKRYFQAMTWLEIGFPVYNTQKGSADLDSARASLLISALLAEDSLGAPLLETWENVYSPLSIFIGGSNDLTPIEALKAISPAFEIDSFEGDNWTAFLEGLADNKKVDDAAFRMSVANPEKNSGIFRLMGQGKEFGAQMLETLSDKDSRPVPSSLDVAAVIGSSKAKKYIDQVLKPQDKWPQYQERFESAKAGFDALNAYHGWLWCLQPLLETPEDIESWPIFAQSSAWSDKALSTALAGWAELKQDTYMYGTPSGVEHGDGMDQTFIGYVEPNIGVYERLLWLHEALEESMDWGFGTRFEWMEELLSRMLECSKKELAGVPLNSSEVEYLHNIGPWLERFTIMVATDESISNWFEIESEIERNMAVSSDVLATENGVLTGLVGNANEILVAVEFNGVLVLTRGAVYDYYETLEDTPYSEAKWESDLHEGKIPERPFWTQSFFTDKGSTPTTDSYYDQFIVPESYWEPLYDELIEGKSKELLRLARFEIYARHGMKFKEKDVQDYFDGQIWYTPIYEPDKFDESMLSDIEKENIEILHYAELYN